MKIQTISDIQPEILLETFNEAFSEYFVPVQLNASQLRDKMFNEGIELSISVGAFDQGRLIGFILHGSGMVDGLKTVYNAGTGVLPSHRGQGLTRKMYEFCLPILKNQGFQLSVLEAIVENVPAIRVYESVGFEKNRTIRCFGGEPAIPVASPPDLTYRRINLPDHEEVREWWNFQPTWQNSWTVACRNTSQYRSIGAFHGEEFIGYISFHPEKGRIQQIGVRPENRRQGTASGLVRFAQQTCAGPLYVINVEETDHASVSFYSAIGLQEIISQFEMRFSFI